MADQAPDEETLLGLMVIPHPLEGREDCLMCHAEEGTVPYPPDHVGRPSSMCLVCHAMTPEESALAVPVEHDLRVIWHSRKLILYTISFILQERSRLRCRSLFLRRYRRG